MNDENKKLGIHASKDSNRTCASCNYYRQSGMSKQSDAGYCLKHSSGDIKVVSLESDYCEAYKTKMSLFKRVYSLLK